LKVTGNYFPVFLMASVSYMLALVIIHLLVPRMEQAQVEEKTR
jgi:ACS family hexuronate transporter-like MFS transporter